MTRREMLAWLEARRPVPPDALRVCLEAAVTDGELSPRVPLPDQLALLGWRVLGRGAGPPDGGPEVALELPARGPPLTSAFEGPAQPGAAGLGTPGEPA